MLLIHTLFARFALGVIVGYLLGRSTCDEQEEETSSGEFEAAAKPVAKERTAGGQPGAVKPEDLTEIEGIGPKISAILQTEGIATFAALATAPVAKLEGILDKAGSRYRLHHPATWPEQAALAAAGRTEEFEELKRRLKGGRPRPHL